MYLANVPGTRYGGLKAKKKGKNDSAECSPCSLSAESASASSASDATSGDCACRHT